MPIKLSILFRIYIEQFINKRWGRKFLISRLKMHIGHQKILMPMAIIGPAYV